MVAGSLVAISGLLVLPHGGAYQKLFLIVVGTVVLAAGVGQAVRRRGGEGK